MRDEQLGKLKKGERTAGISTVTVILSSIAEALIGLLSGSLVLVSDAVHNASDSASGFTSWFSLRISQRKSDEKFPYGYYKAENLASLFISILILYAAFELLLKGYSRVWIIASVIMPLPALGMALVMILLSYFLSRYMRRIGKEINSQTLITNAKEKKTDILSSSVTFIAVLLTYYKVPYVEGVIIIFFSLVTFRVGILSAKDAIFALMDVSPGEELKESIKKILDSIAGVEAYENLKCRRAGPFIFGEVDVKVWKNVDVKRAHEIAENLESTIKEEIEEVASLTIHVEPSEVKEQKIVVPISEDRGLDSDVSEKFGRAYAFIFVLIDRKNNSIQSSRVILNPYKTREVHAGFNAAEFLVEDEQIDVLATKEIGEVSFHTLRSHLVDIVKTEEGTVRATLDKFLNDKLPLLTQPTKESKPTTEGGPQEGIQSRGTQGRRRRGWRRE